MAEEEFESVAEELNVQSKRIFHKWLLKAISENNKEMFEKCVEALGKEWNVRMHVPNKDFPNFVSHLWENRKRIIDIENSYDWKTEVFEMSKMTQKGEQKSHQYSYESKVCFAIAPTRYKIIEDKNTRDNLKILLNDDKKVTKKTFETIVNKWLSQNNIDTTSEDALYRTDYALWSGEAVRNRAQN